MNKTFIAAFGVGIVAVALAGVGIFYANRGGHIDLPGQILKIRTAPLDEGSSVAVVDFRISNPADYLFVVRTVTVTLEDTAGNQTPGLTISETDARALFQGIPLLGAKYNDTLIVGSKVPPHASQDRMISARFELPEAKLEARKRLLIRVEEVNGKTFDFSEK